MNFPSRLNLKWKIQSALFRVRCFGKRLLHLLYRTTFKVRLKSAIERNRLPVQKAASNCEPLFGTLSRRLSLVRREMLSAPNRQLSFWLKSVRPFRGKFCQVTRQFRGYSRDELCLLLNSHPDIAKLDERYPCFLHYYPFTPKFLKNFEEDPSKFVEYITQGFLFGVGFPSVELAKLIVEICGAQSEYRNFESWCEQYWMTEEASNGRL